MNQPAALLLLLGLSGCYGEGKYVPEVTTSFCAVYLECTDEPTKVFDGIDASTCEGTFGPVFAQRAEQCRLVRKAAKDCVEALDEMTCPPAGTAVFDALPAACDLAWKKCTDPVTEDPIPGDTDVSDTDMGS